MKILEEPTYEWKKWFAWRPVRTVDYEWIWIECCERKMYDAKIPNVNPPSWVIYRRLTPNPKKL